jgi:hypothetical protein
MPSVIGSTAGGTSVAVGANYLRTVQSPGADLAGLVAAGTAPLLTFSTPNLRMFKVVVTGKNLTATPEASDSNWSKTVRGLQVTSELFAVFAPANVANGAGEEDDVSTFCYMAPDFNTNAGDVSVKGDAQLAISETGGGFTIVEKAIADALGLAASAVVVTRAAVSGTAIS